MQAINSDHCNKSSGLLSLLFSLESLCSIYITFSHLADAFIQSDLQGCIHIFTFTLMAHCRSGAIRGSVSCSRTLRQGIELATFCLLNDFSTSCTTVFLQDRKSLV